MNSYAEIYTQRGLTDMIERCESKIRRLEIEKEDVGSSWTEHQIKNNKKMIDEEIADTKGDIKDLREALKYRKENKLR